MSRVLVLWAICLVSNMGHSAMPPASPEASEWTVCITNDNCPDYTWGYTEEQTRQALADIVRGHGFAALWLEP